MYAQEALVSRFRLTLLVSLVVLFAASFPSSAAPGGPAAPGRAELDATTALVQLTGEPLSVNARTRPERGQRVDTASPAARDERARLAGIRNDFRAWLRDNAPAARIDN